MLDFIKNKDGFPLFKAIFGSFSLFFNNMPTYVIIGSAFSLVFMIANFISGQSAFCSSINYSKYVFCTNNLFLFIITNLFLWFVTCVYIRSWCQISILKKYKFSIKSMLPNKTDIKIYGILFLFFVSIAIALTSGFLLFAREPNPNWKIEIGYFAVVSIGFFAPIYAISILSYISFAAEEEKMPKIKELWHVSKGKFIMMFMSFFGIVITSFFVSVSVLRYLIQIISIGNVFVVIIAEYFYYMVLMLIACICANYCYLQKKFLFERN